MAFRGVSVGRVGVLLSVERAALARFASTQPGRPPGYPLAVDPGVATPTENPAGDLRDRIRAVDWYHTIDLGGGVITPGAFDHAPVLSEYCLPERLDGMRVLDVATFDGFWAFEFERRGARSVTAVDIPSHNELDYPPAVRRQLSPLDLNRPMGAGFAIASAALKSRVRRELVSVYDLSPERVGTFDLVFCSDLLLHLMHPMRALQAIRSVTSGYALIAEHVIPLSRPVLEYQGGSDRCVWWSFSSECLRRMIEDVGFARVEQLNQFRLAQRGARRRMWHALFKASV